MHACELHVHHCYGPGVDSVQFPFKMSDFINFSLPFFVVPTKEMLKLHNRKCFGAYMEFHYIVQ